jgi:hypothetical protein
MVCWANNSLKGYIVVGMETIRARCGKLYRRCFALTISRRRAGGSYAVKIFGALEWEA